MKLLGAVGLSTLIVLGAVTTQFCVIPISTAADTPAQPKDPELEAKKRAADLAEEEARLQEALKKVAQAQKDAQTAANADLLKAEQEKAKAEAEKAIAEAEKAKLSASLPTPTSKPMEGKVDLDDRAGYFAEIVAYETVRENANDIASSVARKLANDTKVFIVTSPDYLKGGLQLKEIEQRLTAFEDLFDGLSKTNGAAIAFAPLALAAIPAVLGSLADIAGMFRVDR